MGFRGRSRCALALASPHPPPERRQDKHKRDLREGRFSRNRTRLRVETAPILNMHTGLPNSCAYLPAARGESCPQSPSR